MKKLLIITIPIILFLLSIPASAEIYKCIGENGEITFTTKPGPGCKLLPGSIEKKSPAPRQRESKLYPATNIQANKGLTARELYSEFEKNQIAAENRYKGKEIIISGKVEDISRNIAKQPLVTLDAGALRFISCRFAKEDSGQLIDLQKGQFVTLNCKVNYKIFTTIHVYNCAICSTNH